MALILAQISDLHFSHLCFEPSQLLSKRWLGMANLFFCRRGKFLTQTLEELLKELKRQKVTHLLIAGDLTTTSHPKEFELARFFCDKVLAAGIELFIIPGNHDCYTKEAECNKSFYNYFPSTYGSSVFSLKEEGVCYVDLDNNYGLLLLDAALATPLYFSGGLFSAKLEANLRSTLASVPKNKEIILMCHFPFFESKRRQLKREKELQKILKEHPQIKLYLCGHSHKHSLSKPDGLPLLCDSGSCTQKKCATWNKFTLLPGACRIEAFKKESEEGKTAFHLFHEKWYNI